MNRNNLNKLSRTMLILTVAGTAGMGVATFSSKLQADPPLKRLNNDQKVLQILNRLEFGPRPGELQTVQKMGINRWIDKQLAPEAIDDSAVERKLAGLSTLSKSSGDMFKSYQNDQMENRKAQAARKDGETPMPPAMMTPAMRIQMQATRPGTDTIEALGELNDSKLIRACESKRQLQEVLIDFWSNHFNLDVKKGLVRAFKSADERDVIRPHVMGKFREMLEASAKSPAMLFYLDNASSTRDFNDPNAAPPANMRLGQFAPGGAPFNRSGAIGFNGRPNLNRPAGGLNPQLNGNRPGFGAPGGGDTAGSQPPAGTPGQADAGQARPDQPRPGQGQRRGGGLNENYARELLELHTLGVDGGYTQKDVQEVARCFTGWGIDRSVGGFRFYPFLHDFGEKTVLGHRIPAGQGIQDGEMVLDIVALHPATAQHLAAQLCQRLVADEPSKSLVDRAAQTYMKTGGDLRAVVKTIVTSKDILDPALYRAKTKSPFEFAVSSVRALNGSFDVPDPKIPQGRVRLIADGATSINRGGGGRPGGANLRPSLAQEVALMGQPLFSHEAPTGYPEDSREWVSSGSLLTRFNFAQDLAGGRVAMLNITPTDFAKGLKLDDHKTILKNLSKAILGYELSDNSREAILKDMESGSGIDKTISLILGSPEFQRH